MESVRFFYGGEIRVCNSPVPSIETLDLLLDILDRYIYLAESLQD